MLLSRHDKHVVRRAVRDLKATDWSEAGSCVPPVPLHTSPTKDEGGFLLETGGILLAPGAGHNGVGWQGDGR